MLRANLPCRVAVALLARVAVQDVQKRIAAAVQELMQLAGHEAEALAKIARRHLAQLEVGAALNTGALHVCRHVLYMQARMLQGLGTPACPDIRLAAFGYSARAGS